MHAAIVKLSIDAADASAAADAFNNGVLPGICSAPGVTFNGVEYQEVEDSDEVAKEKKYDTIVSSGQSALRALLTINGGSVVVFLTFMGHLLDKGSVGPETMREFVVAFGFFLGAIAMTLMSYGAIFLTNCFSSQIPKDKKWEKVSDRTFYVTVAFGLVALLSFIAGGVTAIMAFASAAGSIIPRP
jgi:hypothetical protein